jgi:hypothetical protein
VRGHGDGAGKAAGTFRQSPSGSLSQKSLRQEEMRLGIARQGVRELLNPQAAISLTF